MNRNVLFAIIGIILASLGGWLHYAHEGISLASIYATMYAAGVAIAAVVITQDAGARAVADMRARKDATYEERNRVVAALARVAVQLGYPVGLARTDIPGWNDAWHNCVYIDLPQGQVSWHYHDDHAHLFAGLPDYTGTYDGHSTPEKYDRLGRYAQVPWTTDAAGKVEPVRCGDVLRQDGSTAAAFAAMPKKHSLTPMTDAEIADYLASIDHDRIPGIGSKDDLAREAGLATCDGFDPEVASPDLCRHDGLHRDMHVIPEPGQPRPVLTALACAKCQATVALKDGLCRACRVVQT